MNVCQALATFHKHAVAAQPVARKSSATCGGCEPFQFACVDDVQELDKPAKFGGIDVTFKAVEQPCKILNDPETHSKFDRECFHV